MASRCRWQFGDTPCNKIPAWPPRGDDGSVADHRDLLRAGFRRGGRNPDDALDCAGVVLELARRRMRPLRDPWDQVREQWQAGQQVPGHAFSAGWRRVDGAPADDDVVILESAREQGVGYVLDGYVWTASVEHGVYRAPLARLAPRIRQVWRWEP